MNSPERYPRKLAKREQEFLYWLLPDERTGYHHYRDLLETMVVLGEGRRGKGNLVLGHPGDVLDLDAPLASVFAFGVIEGEDKNILVTIREEQEHQVEVEIVGSKSDKVPDQFAEKRRWSYSSWSPGDLGPSSGGMVREVKMRGKENFTLVLAISPPEKRLWIYDAKSQVNHLIPVTNFYNELMMLKGIRDPNLALQSAKLFSRLSKFSDEDLARAFLSYNRLRKKVEVGVDRVEVKHELSGWKKFLRTLSGRKS
ncbi:MAG: hypothetical protein ACE5H0_07450 [Bacteroidota bacterium]